MPNIWKHPVIAEPGVLVVDEYVVNNFATFSAAQITAQYSDAELLELYERGVRKIDLRLPFRDVVEDADAGTYTLKAGVGGANSKLDAIDDIILRWHKFPGTSTIMVLAHLAGVNGYIEAMSDAALFAACLNTIVAEMPLSWADPRVMWAWAVEPSATGKTQAQFGKFNYDLAQALGSDFTDRCWLLPINRFSLLSDLPNAVVWSTDGTNFSPPSSGLTSGGGNSGPVDIPEGTTYRFGPFTVPDAADWQITTTFTASGSGSTFRWQILDSNLDTYDNATTSFTAAGPDVASFAAANTGLSNAGVYWIDCNTDDAGVNLTGVTLTVDAGVTEPAGTSLPSEMNVAARAAMYYPFFLGHLASGELDYVDGAIDGNPPNYPYTTGRRDAMRTAVGTTTWDTTPTAPNPGRLATDAAATIGLGFPEIVGEFAKARAFEDKYSIPVIIEECGFAWRTGWGDNGAQIAWFDDVIAASEIFGLRERIGWFSKSPTSPTVVNFALGFTRAVNSVTSVSKSVLKSILKGNINVSSGEVSQMYNAERSDAIAWTPASLGTDLLAWYHGEDLTESDAAAVGTFTARVGWTNTASSSGASRPTCDAAIASMGNVKGLAFTDTQFLDIDGISRAVPFEVYLSCDPTIDIIGAGDQYTNIINVKSSVTPQYGVTAWRNGADTVRAYVLTHAGTNVFGTGTAASPAWTDPQVLGLVIATGTGNSSVRLNGATMVTATATSNTITSLRIGANSTGTMGMQGTVSDIVITKALTTDQRLRLEWWLSTRSGATLTGNKYSGSVPAGL